MSLLSAALLSLVACGGDDGGGIKLVDAKVADAKVFMDARVCTTPAMYGNVSVGTMAAPNPGQYFIKTMSGVVEFGIKVGLGNPVNGLGDYVYFIVPTPSGGFVPNVSYNFQTDPTATMADAIAILDGDAPASGDGAQTLWPENGSIKFDMIGTTNNSNVFATVTMTNFKEIDADGNQVVGGCATAMTSFKLFGKQNADAPARTISTNPTNDTTNVSARKADIRELVQPVTLTAN